MISVQFPAPGKPGKEGCGQKALDKPAFTVFNGLEKEIPGFSIIMSRISLEALAGQLAARGCPCD